MSTDPGLTDAVQRVQQYILHGAIPSSDGRHAEALARAAREDVADRIRQAQADALEAHRRRVVRHMPPGLVSRATVVADLEDYASRIREGREP